MKLFSDPCYISELQQKLRFVAQTENLKPIPPVDGVWNEVTQQALLSFQMRFSIEANGEVNLDTWETLATEADRAQKLLEPPLPLSIFPAANHVVLAAEQGNLLYIIQAVFNNLCIYFTNFSLIPYSGENDEATQQNIRLLQQIYNLPQTGLMDKSTWDALILLFDSVRGTVPIGWALAEKG